MQDSETRTHRDDAIVYARELKECGYDHVYVWHYVAALTGYPENDSRATYAHGYAVNYAGRLRYADGTRAPHTEGVVIQCEKDGDGIGFPLGKMLGDGRALITMGGRFGAYYLAAYNPREGRIQRDESINPGIYPHAVMREITADTWYASPMPRATFYDFRMIPAADAPADLTYQP
jgi:hypothetical protein